LKRDDGLQRSDKAYPENMEENPEEIKSVAEQQENPESHSGDDWSTGGPI
jgi:hypothetical protein